MVSYLIPFAKFGDTHYTEFDDPRKLFKKDTFPENIDIAADEGQDVHKACALQIEVTRTGKLKISHYVVVLVNARKRIVRIPAGKFKKIGNHKSIVDDAEVVLSSFTTWYEKRRTYTKEYSHVKLPCYPQPEFMYLNNKLIWKAPEPDWCESVNTTPESGHLKKRVALRFPPLEPVNPRDRYEGEPKPWV
ncbi:hypothetical protein G6011_00009 [Alternaria panax]|uniref:Uncharacterized protein n=1 Tax=Alternaria panax TaxID=48097 RepID=A0AAD4F7Y2_9PLEO|nr:hypothetical protein G6011_00009 [Alternaria panax]